MITLKKYIDQPVSDWSGGSTRQLAIYPEDAKGADAFDFIFEITSSTMDMEETRYTIYEDYMRTLMIIDGETTLRHADGRIHHLTPFNQCYFDGNCQTYSSGKATDYELMLRKDFQGSIEMTHLDGTEVIHSDRNYLGIYCFDGSCGGCRFTLAAGDQLSAYGEDDITVSGTATLMITRIKKEDFLG